MFHQYTHFLLKITFIHLNEATSLHGLYSCYETIFVLQNVKHQKTFCMVVAWMYIFSLESFYMLEFPISNHVQTNILYYIAIAIKQICDYRKLHIHVPNIEIIEQLTL